MNKKDYKEIADIISKDYLQAKMHKDTCAV